MKLNNNKGAALLITLLIGVVALLVVLALFAFMLFGKGSFTLKERYTSALEAAKGVAYYVMDKLDLGATDIMCYNSNTLASCPCYQAEWDPNDNQTECPAGFPVDAIDLGSYKTLPAANGGTYNINATLIYKDLSYDGNYDIYSIEINAVNPQTKEKATIDFIYKAPRYDF